MQLKSARNKRSKLGVTKQMSNFDICAPNCAPSAVKGLSRIQCEEKEQIIDKVCPFLCIFFLALHGKLS